MEREKLKWEKDFSHNWNMLKYVNIENNQNTNMLVDSNEDGLLISNTKNKNICVMNESLNKIKMENLNYSFNFNRNLIIVIDLSENLALNDFRPTRHKVLFQKLEHLINNYFKYNIVSTITILTMNDYTTQICSPLSSNPVQIISNLKKEQQTNRYPSIYNALHCCLEYMSMTRRMNNEVLFIYSSLNTYDKGNIYELLGDFLFYQTEINFLSFETPFELLLVLFI